jgi:hypothetical protein
MNAAMTGGCFYVSIFFFSILAVRLIYLATQYKSEPEDKRSVVLDRLERKYRREGATNPSMMAVIHIDALRYIDYFRFDGAGLVSNGKSIKQAKEAWLRDAAGTITRTMGNTMESAALIKTIEDFIAGMTKEDLVIGGVRYRTNSEIIDELYGLGRGV